MGIQPWTAAERETFDELRQEGKSYRDIADVIGRPVSAVKNYSYRNKLTCEGWGATPFTKKESQIFISLIRSEKTVADAIPLFPGRSEAAIRKKWERMIPVVDQMAFEDSLSDENVRQDRAFCDAMIAAIAMGLEKAHIGIIATPENGDFRPVNYAPGVQGSCYGSPALLCSEF